MPTSVILIIIIIIISMKGQQKHMAATELRTFKVKRGNIQISEVPQRQKDRFI